MQTITEIKINETFLPSCNALEITITPEDIECTEVLRYDGQQLILHREHKHFGLDTLSFTLEKEDKT